VSAGAETCRRRDVGAYRRTMNDEGQTQRTNENDNENDRPLNAER
jgi:hypothetical protein